MSIITGILRLKCTIITSADLLVDDTRIFLSSIKSRNAIFVTNLSTLFKAFITFDSTLITMDNDVLTMDNDGE